MKVSEIGLFIFLGLMTAVAPLATDMYLPALPELAEFFGISPSLAQLTLTMTMAGMALGQLFGGPLSDRFGRKVPILVGMTVFTLTSYGASEASTPSVLLSSISCRAFSVLSGWSLPGPLPGISRQALSFLPCIPPS